MTLFRSLKLAMKQLKCQHSNYEHRQTLLTGSTSRCKFCHLALHAELNISEGIFTLDDEHTAIHEDAHVEYTYTPNYWKLGINVHIPTFREETP